MNKYTDEQKNKVLTEPDYINSRKHDYSLSKFKERNIRCTTDNIIAHFLCMTPEEVTKTYEDAIKKIRQFMKLDI